MPHLLDVLLARPRFLLLWLLALPCLVQAQTYPACRLFSADKPSSPLPFVADDPPVAEERWRPPIGAAGLAIAGQPCVVHPQEQRTDAGRNERHPENLSYAFRRAIGEPPYPQWGVALAGGGSKAAPVAIGVLAGMHDIGLLRKMDYVSSVSGGSYAAYFLFTRLIHGDRQDPWLRLADAFRDCHRSNQKEIGRAGDAEMCNKVGPEPKAGTAPPSQADVFYRSDSANSAHQFWLKCRQDLLEPGDCNVSSSERDTSTAWLNLGALVTASALTAPAHHLVNSLLDQGLQLSPSAHSYRTGIGLTYGVWPQDSSPGSTRPTPTQACKGQAGCTDLVPAGHGEMATAARSRMIPSSPSFDDLAALNRDGKSAPLWIINAAAAPSRSFFAWMFKPDRDFAADSFEFTPLSHGSMRHGYVSKPAPGVSLLDAVAVSAAFLDANQMVVPGRFPIAVAKHLFNANWGMDLPNWNVSEARRRVHRALPFPLYYADGLWGNLRARLSSEDNDVGGMRASRNTSSFIRVMDGGNTDNLGALALIRRGVRNVVIVDAAQDSDSRFKDLALLCQQLYKHFGLHLSLPHVEGLRELPVPDPTGPEPQAPACKPLPARLTHAQWTEARLFGETGEHEGLGLVYRWPWPVVMGCVSPQRNDDCTGEHVTRIYLLKPALDAARLEREQLATRGGQRVTTRCERRLVVDRTRELGQDSLLPCEPAFFAASNWTRAQRSPYPQGETVSTTFNSSHTKFVAYRDLMRWYAQFLPDESLVTCGSAGGEACDTKIDRYFQEGLARQRALTAPSPVGLP